MIINSVKVVNYLIIYVVKPGDSVYSIAKKYGMEPEKIIFDNMLENPENLAIGQTLVLMTDTVPHKVLRGQSIYSIAHQHKITQAELLAANPQIKNPSRLSIGQTVYIPVKTAKQRTIDVNGYAFPNINKDVLAKTLPFLTYLSIFSYQVRPDGGLNGINDMPLIDAARQSKVAPIMVITNIEEGGGFSSELAHDILNSKAVQENLLNNIENTLKAKNYSGLDIDFEYIYPEDGNAYDRFLQMTADRLKPLGYTIVTSIAPKINENQSGLLYEAHHYKVHGKISDHVVIMT